MSRRGFSTSRLLRRRRVARGVALATFLALAGGFARGAPAGRCRDERPFSPEESEFLASTTRALTERLPAPPSGWTRQSTVVSKTRSPLCEDPGYKPPLLVRVDARYLPPDAPELVAQKQQIEYASYSTKLAAATAEASEAARSRDPKRIERARQALRELKAHPVPTPPDSLPKSPRRLEVRLQANASSFHLCGRSTPVEVRGAAFSFRASGTACRDSIPGDVLSVGFGSWKPPPKTARLPDDHLAAFNEWPGAAVARTRVHTLFLEIRGEKAAVDAVAQSLDMTALEALVGK